ncbi:hypothetical protein GCM10022243_17570 [Saccharothrix violaceirubra]|uniref:Uncharacterized protein n=1 Tax=Saccharothrix violaceirubra TaxID=413306 RepID=A0A7W7WTT0_9PSEU|nr:hypothetical protein [Saccharothrix violaceirubra]MBB4963500.1 hypothetical protein [Saccharothrix violaceirubra]
MARPARLNAGAAQFGGGGRAEAFDNLRHADMSTMDDDAATDLWNSGGRHDYDHIQRTTGRFGNEHYFRNTIYHLFANTRS